MSKNSNVSTREALEKIVSSFVDNNREEIKEFLDSKGANPEKEYRDNLIQNVQNSVWRAWWPLVLAGEQCSLWQTMIVKLEEAIALEEEQKRFEEAEKRAKMLFTQHFLPYESKRKALDTAFAKYEVTDPDTQTRLLFKALRWVTKENPLLNDEAIITLTTYQLDKDLSEQALEDFSRLYHNDPEQQKLK